MRHRLYSLPPLSGVDDMVTEEFPPALKKAPGESTPAFVKRVLTEGHTIPDALLSVAAAQVGCHACRLQLIVGATYPWHGYCLQRRPE